MKYTLTGVFVGLLLLPTAVFGQTIQTDEEWRASLLSQIAQLMEIVQSLQAQLTALQAQEADEDSDEELRELQKADLRAKQKQREKEEEIARRGYWEADDVDYGQVDEWIEDLKIELQKVMYAENSHSAGLCHHYGRNMSEIREKIMEVTHKYEFPQFSCQGTQDGARDRREYYRYVMGL